MARASPRLALVPKLARLATLTGGAAALGACAAVYDLSALGPGDPLVALPEAGADADAGARDAGPLPCPASMAVAGPTCIDRHEATNAEYAAFLEATRVTRPTLPSACDFKSSLTPAAGWPFAVGDEDRAVRHVDWCDALSFCLASGKRLCGRVGTGAPLRAVESGDPATSEWAAACTAAPVGVTDLVGGVAEWVNACETTNGAFDECRVMGATSCTTSSPSARSAPREDQGIRCCAP